MKRQTNMEILNEFAIERSLSEGSINLYKSTLKKYCQVQGMDLYELLEEADKEEEDGIRLKKRTLKSRLIKFRKHLIDTVSSKTVKTYMSRILTFYRTYEIEIPPLPKINTKRLMEYPPVYFKDLPDKEIIKEALNISTPQVKAIILFQTSSGCARKETLNLKVKDFLEACEEYYNKEDFSSLIELLFYLKQQTLVPTFKIVRQKTNKPYYTFCSPEASKAICNFLITRENLNPEDQLFKMNEVTYITNFEKINDTLHLGKVGAYNRFRGHMLRKFHASHLYQGENHLTLDEVDALQGRTRGGSRDSYFMDDTDVLKKRYIECMGNILINSDVEYVTLDDEESVKLLTESYEEIARLKSEKKEIVNYAKAFNQSLTELGL